MARAAAAAAAALLGAVVGTGSSEGDVVADACVCHADDIIGCSCDGEEGASLADDASPANVMLLQQDFRREQRPASAALARPSALQRLVLPWPQRRRPPFAAALKPRPRAQAFVHLFEWSWDDVAKECEEWLGPKGFTAVQISPPNEHIIGTGWYTRYQPVSYNLTSRSGNEEQFASMVRRCRAAGVGIYADTVFNQCAAMGGVGTAGNIFGYRTYPIYGPDDFHHLPGDTSTNCGVWDYQNVTNVQRCDLTGMPDLCTSCENVRERVSAYINRLGSLGVAGFRVDAAKHMDAVELGGLLARVNKGLFRFQEVMATPGEAITAGPYLANGLVTEFAWSSTVGTKFRGQGLLLDDMAKIGEPWGLQPAERSVVFMDDHDTQRSGAAPLTFKSGALYTVATVFMLAYPYGYPKVMSSYYFDDPGQGPPTVPVHGQDGSLHCGDGQPWVCEHRRTAIANMVAWRLAAGEEPLNSWVADGNRLAFCRGSAACVAVNLLQGAPWRVALSTTLPAGEYCDVSQSDDQGCPTVTVDDDGTASIVVPPVGTVAFHVDRVVKVAERDFEDSMPLM